MPPTDTKNICYRPLQKWKYQTKVDYTFATEVRAQTATRVAKPQRSNPLGAPDTHIEWLTLSPDGLLTVRKHYAWDGVTGFPDLNVLMRASLVHDALYQLIREGQLGADRRIDADREFQRLAAQDGFVEPLAAVAYAALRLFGGFATKPSPRRPWVGSPRPCSAHELAEPPPDALRR